MLLYNKILSRVSLIFTVISLLSINVAAQTNDLEINPDSTVIVKDSGLINVDSINSSIDTINSQIVNNNELVKSSDLVPDTVIVDSLSVTYFTGDITNLKIANFSYIDTNTFDFQVFDPLLKNKGMYSTLSNIGLAANNLVYSPTLSQGYYLGSPSFENYYYENQNVKYYNLLVPYSEINYVMGSKKEQNLNVVFARDLFKGFTLGLDFALNSSPPKTSPYLRSSVNNQRFYITMQYYTENKRYGIIANYLRNSIKVEENGGIVYDSIFEDDIEQDRRAIPVNLMLAENQLKQSGFFIDQYFNILPPKSGDSITKRKIDPGNISYSFKYMRNRKLYSDENNDFSFYKFHTAPIDSTSTFDSLTQEHIQNTVKWSTIGYSENPKDKIFYMYLGASHNYIEQLLPYDSVKSSYTQVETFGGIAFNFGRSFHLDIDAGYMFGNYNHGDYQLNAKLKQFLGNKDNNIGFLKFGFNFSNRTPDWYFNNFKSNYYTWSNNLKKERHLIISGSYNYKQISVGAKFFTIQNYTYLNDSIHPTQIDKTETLMQIFAEGTIPFNKLGISTRLVYQTSSRPAVFSFPEISGVIDLYFRSSIFKQAATLQTGFQINYFSEFYADAYMPALRLFYKQNEIKIGNYPYADFYITLMVKRARLFFKMSHFNGYFSNYSYFKTPHYPARDASIYFGVSWRFHD
jgi:putative beta-barrel porin